MTSSPRQGFFARQGLFGGVFASNRNHQHLNF